MEVQGIGDINAEGLSDFAIMACKYLRIFSGNNLKIASEIILEKNWWAFYSVIGKFDINNDRDKDIIIGDTYEGRGGLISIHTVRLIPLMRKSEQVLGIFAKPLIKHFDNNWSLATLFTRILESRWKSLDKWVLEVIK